YNQLCEILADLGKKNNWVVFQEPLIRDQNNELFKPDLVFVKNAQAVVVDVTVRYESKPSSLADAAEEKVKKYQHLTTQVQDLTNATEVKFVGFPLGACGKWFSDNFKLLTELGLTKSCQQRTAIRMSYWALFSSVDIIHMFAGKSR
ncbi:hypothetical protein N331_11913, partial [Merops nubicus]